MSSVAEKNEGNPSNRPQLIKRNFFLRSSSIQKIKCSATYPFRIAGSKLSRDAIKQLLESLIIKARLFSQKALLIIYIATLKVLGAIAPAYHSLSASCDICDNLKETEKRPAFTERLLIRVISLYLHKCGHRPEIKEPVRIEKTFKTNTKHIVDTPKPTIQSEANKLRLAPEKTSPKKPNLMFVTFVYAGALAIYIQLVILFLALNAAPAPPGLIFLIISLSLIALLALQVFLMEHSNKKSLKRSRNTTENHSPAKNTQDLQRGDRTRIRRTLDWGGRTLSKIKML